MPDSMTPTPVVMIIFNRPDLTRRLVDAVRPVAPAHVYVIADGPRPTKPEDAAKCEAARAEIDRIDWPCELIRDFAPANLGVSRRIMSGYDAVFDRFEQAIILEDDCIPHPDFFRFCAEILARYRDEPRVRNISGINFLNGRTRNDDSYHFSNYHHNWGFATWRRSWLKVDQAMSLWPEVRDGGWMVDLFGQDAQFWTSRFENTFTGRTNSWVYRWQLSCALDQSLCVVPNRNLVSNVGFRADATTTAFDAGFANAATGPLAFPLKHPHLIVPDRLSDAETFKNRFAAERASLHHRLARSLYYRITNRPNPFAPRVPVGRLSERVGQG